MGGIESEYIVDELIYLIIDLVLKGKAIGEALVNTSLTRLICRWNLDEGVGNQRH